MGWPEKREKMTTLADVADVPQCVFCGGNDLQSMEGGWMDCLECTASIRYSQRLGRIVDDTRPEDLDAVSTLLHELRKGS